MSDSIPKIIHELNNKNFKKALNLCEKYSENNAGCLLYADIAIYLCLL